MEGVLAEVVPGRSPSRATGRDGLLGGGCDLANHSIHHTAGSRTVAHPEGSCVAARRRCVTRPAPNSAPPGHGWADATPGVVDQVRSLPRRPLATCARQVSTLISWSPQAPRSYSNGTSRVIRCRRRRVHLGRLTPPTSMTSALSATARWTASLAAASLKVAPCRKNRIRGAADDRQPISGTITCD